MGGEDEGVVLKKSRGQYTCAPADLATGEAGFFDAVVQLNVKVSRLLWSISLPSLTQQGRNDGLYSGNPSIAPQQHNGSHKDEGGTSGPGVT